MAVKSRIDAWTLLRVLVVPCLFLCAIFKRPIFQWIACAALFVWVCFVISKLFRAHVNRSESVGSEQRSGRPAIIVSNPVCNEHSPVVEVVYLTCQYKHRLPTHVRIESTGRRSTALCEQITSVDVSRLGDYKGHATDEEMQQIDAALLCSLGIHPLTQQATVEKVVQSVDDSALALIALRFLEGFIQTHCGVEISSSLSAELLTQKNG